MPTRWEDGHKELLLDQGSTHIACYKVAILKNDAEGILKHNYSLFKEAVKNKSIFAQSSIYNNTSNECQNTVRFLLDLLATTNGKTLDSFQEAEPVIFGFIMYKAIFEVRLNKRSNVTLSVPIDCFKDIKITDDDKEEVAKLCECVSKYENERGDKSANALHTTLQNLQGNCRSNPKLLFNNDGYTIASRIIKEWGKTKFMAVPVD